MTPEQQVIRKRWARTVVFLQNAWSPTYAGSTWPRGSWLRALGRSRSGRRLGLLVPDPECCHNTTPIVGAAPSSVVPPDEQHIREIISRVNPRLVVACGRQAEGALRPIWSASLIAVPHPAARLLTDALYVQARALIEDRAPGRWALRQRRGRVVLESLEDA